MRQRTTRPDNAEMTTRTEVTTEAHALPAEAETDAGTAQDAEAEAEAGQAGMPRLMPKTQMMLARVAVTILTNRKTLIHKVV